MKKTKTTKIGGGADYAKVSERIKEFRSDCPNGLIETTPTITENNIIFKCRILKDKSDPASAEAIGHSMGTLTGQKAFEKLESISVGRALAMLGYCADGEIATSEEMEEFNEYQKGKKEDEIIEALTKMSKCKTQAELKDVFSKLGTVMREPEVIAKKDELKATLK